MAEEPSERKLETPASLGPEFPVLIMTVALAGGKQDTIAIHKQDSPAQLAQAFGKKHHLKLAMVKKIQGLITTKKTAATRFISSQRAQPKSHTTNSTSRLFSTQTFSSAQPLSTSQVSPKNYGDFLYSRRPRPSPLSPRLSQPVLTPNRRTKKDAAHEEKLILQGELKERKLKEMRSRSVAAELKDCTFTPAVNPRSVKLDRSTSAGTGVHRIAKLHSDAYEKELRLIDRYEAAAKYEFPFHPATISQRKTSETQSAMIQRLLTSKARFQEAINKARTDLDKEVPDFKPSTCRGPTTVQRRGNVFDSLYGLRSRHDAVVQQLQHKYLHQNGESRMDMSKSLELAADFRRRRIEILFSEVDSDRDNLLDFESLNARNLDSRTVELLNPVWAELQERDTPADFDWFLQRVEGVLSSVSNEEKTYLLKAFAALAPKPVASTPKSSLVNLISEQLASKRRSQLGADIYTRRTTEKAKTAEKVKEMQTKKAIEELKDCSFRPSTLSYPRTRNKK